ncbi:hypothetical protein DM02DRAFT_648012 [Periconia macrospinosa]|uniref:Uncharacterized protein n=1 Tax=Periconia macrospinosa TaxID=97972 RepID=A0A2V1EH38_9PLEO|nr:hypothetical protein DM02DRAFT_648012 [Periconia macrospinosa]
MAIGTAETVNDYRACAGSRPGGRCNYGELMEFMRSARERTPWTDANHAVYKDNGRLNEVETAKKCYQKYQERGRFMNFPANKAMKGNVWEWNDYIMKLGDRVNFVHQKKNHLAPEGVFEEFDRVRDDINKARAGDHGDHLIEAARGRMRMPVYTKSLGNNPATNEQWRTVDWAETANKGRAAGFDAAAEIRTFLNGFYRNPTPTADDNAAARHFHVFRSYKYTNDRAVSCGGRGMQKV